MATTNPITQSTATTTGTKSTTTTGPALGKDDFLKLLVGQLQHQDPLQPSDDTQFIGQMADQLSRAGALGLIGRTVTYTDADGASQTGTVSQVDVGSDGKATLTVDGKGGIDAGAVTQVK